ISVGEQELVVVLVEFDALHRFAGAEALVQLRAVTHILEFDLQISAALARLGMLGLDRAPQPALMLDDVSGTNGIPVDLHDAIPCAERGAGAKNGAEPNSLIGVTQPWAARSAHTLEGHPQQADQAVFEGGRRSAEILAHIFERRLADESDR